MSEANKLITHPAPQYVAQFFDDKWEINLKKPKSNTVLFRRFEPLTPGINMQQDLTLQALKQLVETTKQQHDEYKKRHEFAEYHWKNSVLDMADYLKKVRELNAKHGDAVDALEHYQESLKATENKDVSGN